MKKITLILILALSFSACSPLRTTTKKEREIKNAKMFNINDFRPYVFNICEKYGEGIDNAKRFCECPDNFYEVAQRDSIKKVEELYLLIHRKTDLVLYLTTTSHKYIREDASGFLMDPKRYKDNIVLNDIESVYLGRIDRTSGYIHFPSFEDRNDIILHYDKEIYKQKNYVFMYSGNMATAENDYDIAEEIPLDRVFNQDLVYKYKPTMSLKYFNRDDSFVQLDRFQIKSDKGKVKIFVGFEGDSELYALTYTTISYHPNYSLIQEH